MSVSSPWTWASSAAGLSIVSTPQKLLPPAGVVRQVREARGVGIRRHLVYGQVAEARRECRIHRHRDRRGVQLLHRRRVVETDVTPAVELRRDRDPIAEVRVGTLTSERSRVMVGDGHRVVAEQLGRLDLLHRRSSAARGRDRCHALDGHVMQVGVGEVQLAGHPRPPRVRDVEMSRSARSSSSCTAR